MKRLLLLTVAAGPALAQNFALEGAVIDSRSSRNLGVVSERGSIDSLFRAQKAMTFGILRAAGISLEQLPSDIRARIERFQTTNVEAFRAYSQGLDLKDQGRFVEAKELFRRAAQLDPGFALAVEQQQAMPDANLGTAVQTRALLAAASTAAVDRGKSSITVDVSRATAAVSTGLGIVAYAVPADTLKLTDYTVNPAGSGTSLVPNLVVGLSYQVAGADFTGGLANVNEYAGVNYRVSGGVLESVGNRNDPAGEFSASRGGAAVGSTGSATLADGSTVYWGRWNAAPGATPSVSGVPASAALGPVDWIFANATPQMPTTGSATFTPTGGTLASPAGTIAVNFVSREVRLQNLGFTIAAPGGNQVFSGLNGVASYSSAVASGAFGGYYSAGSCSGCPAFDAAGSLFGGNFVGRDAAGLVFSTILLTGNGGVSSGVQLFKKP